MYAKCTSIACTAQTEVEVYLKINNGEVFDTSTIFKVTNNGKAVYLLNKVSSVFVGKDTNFSFRNPPSFYGSPTATLPEAEYEMEAYLDHLFYHPNTAPFLCHLMIQRLVTSNPSPRYVRAVVDAFRSGTYDGTTYSGVYGDLEATFYAILMDREARSPLLDGDPSHGHLREPLLKIVHSMKSLEYQKRDNYLAEFWEMQDKIGQEFNMQTSVFGFYQPDHSPDGPIGDADLLAPEAQLITGPNNIGYLNGMISLVENGLTNHNYGFGSSAKSDPLGKFTYTPTWETAEVLVDDLDLLLTGGRLSSTSSSVIRAVVDDVMLDAILPDELILGTEMSCTASSEYPQDQWKCINALQPGGAGWAMYKNPENNNWDSIGQWISILFTKQYELTGFAWQNRGGRSATFTGMDIKDVTLEFSDGSTQQKTIERWSSTEGCHSVSPTAALTCFQSLAPVTTVSVKFTVDSVHLPDTAALGASNIKLFTKPGVAESDIALQAAQMAALKEAQILIMASSEFHTTSLVRLQENMRAPVIKQTSLGRRYKAVIMILLNGGADTHNMVMPHSGCAGPTDLNTEYNEIRGNISLSKAEVHTITSQTANPCTTYGLHPELPLLKELYEEGSASFFLNMGAMVEPITKAEYQVGLKKRPTGLFGHFTMCVCN